MLEDHRILIGENVLPVTLDGNSRLRRRLGQVRQSERQLRACPVDLLALGEATLPKDCLERALERVIIFSQIIKIKINMVFG